MPIQNEPANDVLELDSDPALQAFLKRFDAGGYDGHLFEEIRKLDVAALEKVCRVLSKRQFRNN